MAIENRNQILASRTEDAKEGMRAFVEKRAPVWVSSGIGWLAGAGLMTSTIFQFLSLIGSPSTRLAMMFICTSLVPP